MIKLVINPPNEKLIKEKQIFRISEYVSSRKKAEDIYKELFYISLSSNLSLDCLIECRIQKMMVLNI